MLTRPGARFPSDLSDAEWAILEPLVPAPKPGGRPAVHPRREVVNAILYVLRTDCHWRALPSDLPPWGTVWWSFRTWRQEGVWERVNTALRERVRVAAGRADTPSAAILDSQSAKTTERGGSRLRPRQEGDGPQASLARGHRGMGPERPGRTGRRARQGRGAAAAGDPRRGRDHAATGGDLGGWRGQAALRRVGRRAPGLARRGGPASRGRAAVCVGGTRPGTAPPAGFRVLPRRWVVERTFAWLGRNRRLSRDYEVLPETGETWISLAMTRLMLRRLAA